MVPSQIHFHCATMGTPLVLDLIGNTFSFSLLIMLALGLSYVAFIMIRYFPSMLTFWRGFFFFLGAILTAYGGSQARTQPVRTQ